MSSDDSLRPGEKTVDYTTHPDATLFFIGRARTPWKSREECPRQGQVDGPICRIELFRPWNEALKDIEHYSFLEILYWLHQARRDLVLQSPRHNGVTSGTFALRSPVRPNPIGLSTVSLVERDGSSLLVRGLDCIDHTPVLDIKPDRSVFNSRTWEESGANDAGQRALPESA